jgi:hypothetical protein
MLYLRNTNQLQSLGKDVKRGVTNICCTPTLNSVVSASLTQVTINSTFGAYLINCKSCVGGYIQVSENSGSSWTTINPGNCSTTNLVPMPSQSAYYRLFTSCSSVNQPNDPLSSSFSNEVLFIPNGYINYNYIQNISSNFKIVSGSTTYLNASSSVSGTLWQIPSGSNVTASLTPLSFPITGSTSMSLSVSGSNVSYTTSSCVYTSSILLKDFKVIPNQFYNVSASISHRPENTCTASNYSDLGYTVNSYDQSTGRWYHANQYGVPDTSSTYPYAVLVGASTATRTNVVSGDCRYNAIQFSGSMTLDIGSGSAGGVYLAIVTGSFSLSGVSKAPGGGFNSGWDLSVAYLNSGSINGMGYQINNATTKNTLVGLEIGTYVSPYGENDMSIYASGSVIANNPPTWAYAPHNFGYVITLTGQGIIRGFGYQGPGTSAQQSQYNCIYDTTPSK